MNFQLGNINIGGILPVGIEENFVSPCCEKLSRLYIYEIKKSLPLPFFKNLSGERRYLAKPACCDKVFLFNTAKGDAIKRKEKVFIMREDLYCIEKTKGQSLEIYKIGRRKTSKTN